MGKDKLNWRMGMFIKVRSRMDRDMAVEFVCLKVELSIEGNGVMINQMEMEFCILALTKLLKVDLIMDRCQVVELKLCFKTEVIMKGITATTEDTEPVFAITQTVNYMKDNGPQTKELVVEK